MAKKEPSGNFGSRKDGNGGKPEIEGMRAGKAPVEAEAKNERIPKLELVTRVQGQRADGAGKTQRHTWDVLKKNLESWQAAQKKEKDIEKAHSRHYTIEADREAKVKAYNDALEEDKRGKKGPTKTAKKAKDAIEKVYKKVQQDRKNKRFDREKRRAEHDAMTDAQESLEDWLYFQDSSKRRKRLRLLSPEGRKLAEQERFQRGTAYKLEASGKDSDHYDWVHSLLELYDSRDIGGQNYKQGLHDRLGNSVENSKNGRISPVVGPNELHMWTPNYRRRLVGLCAPEEDDDSDTSQDIEPTHFRLDKTAIEAKRAAVEKKSDTKTQNLEFDTHEARRRHEVETYGNSRPDTSADRMTNTPNGVVAENRWREIRTEQGLFISARESSWDWRTSYDCLGPVMSGWFPETSAIRDEAPEEWIDPDDKPGNVDGDDSERSAPRVPEEQAGELLRGASDKRAKKRGTAQEPPGEATRGKQPANDKSGPAKPVNKSQKKVKVEIDYRYPASEFCKEKRPFRPVERRWFTTEWAEETTGRRERHTYHMEPHSSPVHSPPRSPIMEEITAIPVGFPESDARAVPLERRSQRKCLLNLNRCRAFWTHSLNECWIPYSERPKRPKDPIEWPIQEIDPPKGEDEDGSNGYVPTIGIPVYRSRLYDHYGLMYPNTSPSEDWKRQQWPRIGIRVPYEPMTIEDLRVRGADEDAMAIDATTRPAREIEHGGGARDNDMGTEGYNELSDTPDPTDSASNKRRKLGTILAPDADKRALYEVRSMAVPVIATPQRPWAPLKDDRADEYHGDGYDSDDNGSETDDDGDLFFKSYEAGCFPNGRPAPIVPPVTSAENHEPGTAPEDVQPASAAPEVVMTEESDDADL